MTTLSEDDKERESSLKDLFKEVKDTPIKGQERDVSGDRKSLEQDSNFLSLIKLLSSKVKITDAKGVTIQGERCDHATILKLIYLLHGRGLVNKNTPLDVFVKIQNKENDRQYTLTKETYMDAYKNVFKNMKLRKTAVYLRNEISDYLYKSEKEGDLARKFERYIIVENAKKEIGTTEMELPNRLEAAWCNSFNQNNPELARNPELKRVNDFLIEDYKNLKKEVESMRENELKRAKTSMDKKTKALKQAQRNKELKEKILEAAKKASDALGLDGAKAEEMAKAVLQELELSEIEAKDSTDENEEK